MVTPEQVHYGQAQEVYEKRSKVLLDAYDKNPNRFKNRVPKPYDLPPKVWINKPKTDFLESNLLTKVSLSH